MGKKKKNAGGNETKALDVGRDGHQRALRSATLPAAARSSSVGGSRNKSMALIKCIKAPWRTSECSWKAGGEKSAAATRRYPPTPVDTPAPPAGFKQEGSSSSSSLNVAGGQKNIAASPLTPNKCDAYFCLSFLDANWSWRAKRRV